LFGAVRHVSAALAVLVGKSVGNEQAAKSATTETTDPT
jgi:hypothetical protein